VLVEAHDAREVERALNAGAQVVGINSRDLSTFAEDLGVATGLSGLLPPEVITVAESAIRTTDDARRVAAAGFDAILVGEALVRAEDPTALVRDLASVSVARRSAA
jgi:indole-3-glycerol phosphate synthase